MPLRRLQAAITGLHTTASPANNPFETQATHWWDETGPFAPLHALNPLRVGYVQQQWAAAHAGASLQGLRVLDVGCGGGLLSVALARLGAHVTGIDTSEPALRVARTYSKEAGLEIDWQNTTTTALVSASAKRRGSYDLICASEVIEHVDDGAKLIREISQLLAPQGMVFISTLNRTLKSLIFGKYAAEYVLGLAPKGAHEWQKFVQPAELASWAQAAGLNLHDIQGVVYRPLTRQFRLARGRTAINYFAILKL